jgi:hypothetical protein
VEPGAVALGFDAGSGSDREARRQSIEIPPARKTHKTARRLLLCEALGFVSLIALSWLDELLDLPARWLGSLPGHDWHEAALETVVIVAVAVPTFLWSLRLAKRLVYLEDFLRVCAWCRRIDARHEWISVEDYFHRELKTDTSHGICPECAAKLEEEFAQ